MNYTYELFMVLNSENNMCMKACLHEQMSLWPYNGFVNSLARFQGYWTAQVICTTNPALTPLWILRILLHASHFPELRKIAGTALSGLILCQ